MLGWLLASIDRLRRWPANYENRIVAAVAVAVPLARPTEVRDGSKCEELTLSKAGPLCPVASDAKTHIAGDPRRAIKRPVNSTEALGRIAPRRGAPGGV